MSAIIEFHFGQAEYSQSCECLRSCLGTEHSMMKFNTLFECGPSHPISTSHPSDVIHMISVPRPSLIRLNTKMKNNYNKKFSLSNSVLPLGLPLNRAMLQYISNYKLLKVLSDDFCETDSSHASDMPVAEISRRST